MKTELKYNLVYITTDGEYKTPNAAMHLFERAQYFAANKTENSPTKTEVWIVGTILEYIDLPSQSTITELSIKCPDIRIRMLNGINILHSFPILPLMKIYRKLLITKIPVIYICTGESAFIWANKLQQHFTNDVVVIDVREYTTVTP